MRNGLFEDLLFASENRALITASIHVSSSWRLKWWYCIEFCFSATTQPIMAKTLVKA
jgi:hypothetical protein